LFVICALFVRYLCVICALFVRYLCVICALFVRYLCVICALFEVQPVAFEVSFLHSQIPIDDLVL